MTSPIPGRRRIRRRPATPSFQPRVVAAPESGVEEPALDIGRVSLAGGLVRTMRPRQWLKNGLVLAAPAAAGVLTHRQALSYAAAAFVLFCLAASGTYFINDVLDRHADQLHPTKRRRAIASGVVPVPLALTVGAVLLALALGGSAAIGRPQLALVLGCYVGVTLCYSVWLKHEPILDIGAVAAGFVLRAIVGGVATKVPLSNWFIIVACFGSLFMVTGKRDAEVKLLGDGGEGHRATLGDYTENYLRFVLAVTAGVTMTAYCLWAFQKANGARGAIWFELSIVPFVLGVLRYGLLVDAGHGGAPEDVVLEDRVLQVLGLCLILLFAVGVYR